MNKEKIFNIFLIISSFLISGYAAASGLKDLESGTREGIHQLQSYGLILAGGAFVVGGIYSKFNADRGKDMMIWAVLGCIAVVIGPTIPEMVNGLFGQ